MSKELNELFYMWKLKELGMPREADSLKVVHKGNGILIIREDFPRKGKNKGISISKKSFTPDVAVVIWDRLDLHRLPKKKDS